MKLCRIRDDDVNAFTRPEDLQRVHAPLLERAVFFARYLLGTVPGTLYMLWRSGLPRQARGVLLGLGDALRGRYGKCPHRELYPSGGSAP